MSESVPDDVTIRPAETGDVGSLADLWVELAADQRRYGSHLVSEKNRSAIRRTMLQHIVAETALVARRDGSVVGFVTFDVEAGQYRQDVSRGIIRNIFVRDNDRNNGIGDGLLKTAEGALESRGADVVALEAMAGNRRARQFYRRCGYEPHRIELEKPINSDTQRENGE